MICPRPPRAGSTQVQALHLSGPQKSSLTLCDFLRPWEMDSSLPFNSFPLCHETVIHHVLSTYYGPGSSIGILYVFYIHKMPLLQASAQTSSGMPPDSPSPLFVTVPPPTQIHLLLYCPLQSYQYLKISYMCVYFFIVFPQRDSMRAGLRSWCIPSAAMRFIIGA